MSNYTSRFSISNHAGLFLCSLVFHLFTYDFGTVNVAAARELRERPQRDHQQRSEDRNVFVEHVHLGLAVRPQVEQRRGDKGEGREAERCETRTDSREQSETEHHLNENCGPNQQIGKGQTASADNDSCLS
jgi:hypothetical protein